MAKCAKIMFKWFSLSVSLPLSGSNFLGNKMVATPPSDWKDQLSINSESQNPFQSLYLNISCFITKDKYIMLNCPILNKDLV